MSKNPSIIFGEGGLRATDLTPEDVRSALELPRVEETSVIYGVPGGYMQSDKHVALINPETEQLYGIHSDQYRVVRHEEAILDIMSVVEQNPEFGRIEWTAQGHGDYKRMMARGQFIDITREVVPGDQGINPTLDYFNSYDGSWGERLLFGAYRLVCKNGMVALENLAKFSVPHIGSERPAEFLTQIGESLEGFSAQTEIWKSWVDRTLSIAHVEDTIDRLELTKDERAAVLEEADEGQMDLWSWYNVFTALITHRIKSLDRQVRSWNRLRQVQSNW